MKKILLLMMVAFALSSCGTMKYYELSTNVNLKEYTGDDFIINPSSLTNGEFDPLGIVCDEFYIGTSVGKEYKDVVEKKKPSKYSSITMYLPTTKHMFDKFIGNAKSIGANGIVDFKMNNIYNKDMALIGYRMEGVAVRFK